MSADRLAQERSQVAGEIVGVSDIWLAAAHGKPYRVGARGPDAYDCWGAVRAFLASAGFGEVTSHTSGWKLLGSTVTAARKVGDVVLTDGPDARQGVAACVSVSPLRFVTSTPADGVHVVPARSLADSTRAVYRWGKVKP